MEGKLLRFEFLVCHSKSVVLLKFMICVHHHDQMKENETGGACDTCGGGRRECRVLVGETDRRRPLGRPKRGWEGNTKMAFKEIGWGRGLD